MEIKLASTTYGSVLIDTSRSDETGPHNWLVVKDLQGDTVLQCPDGDPGGALISNADAAFNVLLDALAVIMHLHWNTLEAMLKDPRWRKAN